MASTPSAERRGVSVMREDDDHAPASTDAPPASEARRVPLEKLADLTADDLARVDEKAAAHGVTRGEMLDLLLYFGLLRAERGLAPTRLRGSPTNENRQPPRGKRRPP